jgi:hypothetical protein
MNFKSYRIACTILALSVTLVSASLGAQTAGEEWEFQGNMDMMGMKMPIPPTKRCQNPAEENNTPPVDSNCEVNDVVTEGNTTRFKMLCGEPNPMQGSGTTTRTDDKVDVSYTMTAEGAEMTFTMTGKKLGACTL